ncbi:MAG TPA: hypothetical protein VGK45_02020, partial [Thermoanaerobaculia bacterium]
MGSHPTGHVLLAASRPEQRRATETRNRSVCSALVAHLFSQAYGYRAADYASWLGGRFPRAAGFHDAIAGGHGFDPVH